MTHLVDPAVLHKVAREAVSLGLDDAELIARVTQLLADEYPHLISTTPGRWVASKAGGNLGKVRMLYFTPREYVVIFGTPIGTQGFSGRYKRVDVHKFLLAGQIDSFDLESDDLAATHLMPGDHFCMEKGRIRGITIHPGSWHIEYGRGPVLTTLPLAMVDTLLLSLEAASVRRSAAELISMFRRRPR